MMEAVSGPETLVISTRLHGATSQKTDIFIHIAVRALNLTSIKKDFTEIDYELRR
jgi:hypothetical protein